MVRDGTGEVGGGTFYNDSTSTQVRRDSQPRSKHNPIDLKLVSKYGKKAREAKSQSINLLIDLDPDIKHILENDCIKITIDKSVSNRSDYKIALNIYTSFENHVCSNNLTFEEIEDYNNDQTKRAIIFKIFIAIAKIANDHLDIDIKNKTATFNSKDTKEAIKLIDKMIEGLPKDKLENELAERLPQKRTRKIKKEDNNA